MPYDVSIGFGLDEPPKLLRISHSESDGSCMNIKDAKEWWLRELAYWYDEQCNDVKNLRAADVERA